MKHPSLSAKGALSAKHFLSVAIQREWRLSSRRRHELLTPLAFYLMVLVLFPLAMGPNASILAVLAPGALWIATLLACISSTQMLFREDYEDGTLEQVLLSKQPLSLFVLAKIIVHWLLTGLPLTLLSPLFTVMFSLPLSGVDELLVTLLLATPLMSLLSALGAGLTVGLARAGFLVAVLVLPIQLPVLIFGTAATVAAVNGLPILGYLAILGGMLMLALVLIPWVVTSCLRISLSQ